MVRPLPLVKTKLDGGDRGLFGDREDGDYHCAVAEYSLLYGRFMRLV
jgi:hypothetical protein